MDKFKRKLAVLVHINIYSIKEPVTRYLIINGLCNEINDITEDQTVNKEFIYKLNTFIDYMY